MNKDPQFRVGRIAWMFKKSGAEGGQTHLYENLPAETKEQVSKTAELRQHEVPTLAYIASNSEWVLATNERVIWLGTDGLASLEFAQIEDAIVEHGDLLQARGKGGLGTLTLKTTDGRVHKLALESGEPFSGFWNALKMMAHSVTD